MSGLFVKRLRDTTPSVSELERCLRAGMRPNEAMFAAAAGVAPDDELGRVPRLRNALDERLKGAPPNKLPPRTRLDLRAGRTP